MSVTIAKNRIRKLFSEADKIFPKSPKLANRYVGLARKIAMKVNLHLPKYQKRKFCKHCYHYLKPGVNSRIRIHKSRVIIYCLDCKKFTRIPIKPKK
jgi:ribonuclease P protein subunit RPR2|tara:strand:- start:192 stop:482 length:291 start_codon:yes stop_codon:yes gene_type:complete